MPIESGNLGDTSEMQEAKKIVTNEEIGRIEAVKKDVDDAEKDNKMKGFIEKESKDELNRIKSQCLNVIKNFVDDDDGRGQDNAVKAIISLLRINQILGKIQLQGPQGEKKLDLKGDYLNQLKDIIGNKGFDFSNVLKGEEGQVLNAACTKILNSLRASQEIELRNKDNEQKSSAIDTIKGYITMAGDKKGVNAAFIELKRQINGNEGMKDGFSKAVFDLINKCCPDLATTTGELNDDFYSEKVKSFQQIVENSDNEEAKELLSNGMKKAVDGKLGRNTLNALVKFAEKGWVFNAEPIKQEEGSIKIDAGKEKIETGNMLDRMPTTFDAIKKYGELSDRNGYQIFSFNDMPGTSDFVKRESGTGNEYVQIAGKKYYIKGGESDDLHFKNRPISRERYGDIQKVTELCFGKFNQEGKLTEGSKIVIDSEGKQIESVIMTDETVTDKDGNEQIVGLRTMGGKVKKGVDENGNETTRNDIKWRIDLFDKEDGKDTKRLSDDQLDAIINDKEACKVILDLAINAFTDTMHKPSTVGRYNLNSIVSRLLTELPDEGKKILVEATGNRGYLESGLTRKERVASFLRLEHGFFSDPDNKINKSDLEGEELKIYNSKKTNAEKREYRSTLKQGDRIINRLKLLKKALEGKTDNIPAAPAAVARENGGNEDPTPRGVVETAVGPLNPTEETVDAITGGSKVGEIPAAEVPAAEVPAAEVPGIDIDKLNSNLASILDGLIINGDKGNLVIEEQIAEMIGKETILSDGKSQISIDDFLGTNESICGVSGINEKMKLAYLALNIYREGGNMDTINISADGTINLEDSFKDPITFSSKFGLKKEYVDEFKKIYEGISKYDAINI